MLVLCKVPHYRELVRVLRLHMDLKPGKANVNACRLGKVRGAGYVLGKQSIGNGNDVRLSLK